MSRDQYKRTCLESRMHHILSEAGVDFNEQLPTRSGFVIDFGIVIDRKNSKMLAFETDGRNWHTSDKQKKRDIFRDRLLLKEGWTVIRFDEDFTKEQVINKLNEYNILPPA